MCFGSEIERTHDGECRTTEDVRKLFERYRARAREGAEQIGRDLPADKDRKREAEPALAGR